MLQTRKNQTYLERVLVAYEDEISGEAYYKALCMFYPVPEYQHALRLLAKVECKTAETLRPLTERYNLVPRSKELLITIGEGWAEQRAQRSWVEFTTDMTERFKAYVEEFQALETMGPVEDMAALKTLTEHEVVCIEFAQNELNGAYESTAPLENFLTNK